MASLIQRFRRLAPGASSTGSMNHDEAVSMGPWVTKMNGYNFWDMRGHTRDQWVRLAVEIKSLLVEQSDPVPETVIWAAYMVRKTAKTARPTVIFCSPDATSRRTVRDLVRSSQLLNRYPGFVTAERVHPPDFSHLMPLRDEYSCSLHLAKNNVSRGMICVGSQADEQTRATLGGLVCIHNVNYYFTVAHVFTGRSIFASWESSGDGGDEFDMDEDEANDFQQTDSDLVAATSTASISPASSSGSGITTSSSVGSTNRLTDRQIDNIAIRGAEGKFSKIDPDENRYGDPIASSKVPFPLSEQGASDELATSQPFSRSVLLPTEGNDLNLDYALLEMPKTEAEWSDNYVLVRPPASRRHGSPQAAEVVALTAKNSLVPGSLSAIPTFITNGVRTQEIWTVRLDGTLVGGDCGTWVVDAQSRKLCGHIVAGNPGAGTAYIVPAYDVFRDAKRWIGTINLPSPPTPLVSSLFHYALRKLLPTNMTLTITMVGLDASGKSSLLGVLSKGQLPTTIPTVGFNLEDVIKDNVTLHMFDLAGSPKLRALWRHYCVGLDALIFVFDSADHDRALEARQELHNMLEYPELVGTPLLVLGNKCDLRGAVSVDELAEVLQLGEIRDREVACYSVSAVTSKNLDLVLRWLVARILRKSQY